MEIFWSNSIWNEQEEEVQFLIVHFIFIESDEPLQLNSIVEVIEKSWLRRYCNGDDKDDWPGISIIVGAKQA